MLIVHPLTDRPFADPLILPYRWRCVAIEGNPEKGHCRVEFEAPMGKIEFWVAQPSFLKTLKVGEFYTFGFCPAYETATVPVAAS
jgi:hypothetical protein